MTWLEAMDQCTCDTLNECSLFAHGTATRPAQMTPYVSCSRTPSETVLTAFGVTSPTFMRAMYALERRGSRLNLGIRTRMRTLVGGTGSSQGLGRSGSSRLSGRSSHSDDSA